jgi:hypothetical protein
MWYFFKLPFMLLRIAPKIPQILRHEAAAETGSRARSVSEQLVPAQDQAVIAGTLAAIAAHDPGFDARATTEGVVRARDTVDRSRQSLDLSEARLVVSDGLWRVFAMLQEARSAHGLRRQGASAVTSATVVEAIRDQLSEQLRVRLTCEGERWEEAEGLAVRGQSGRRTWHEDWTVRRSSTATTVPGGGLLQGRCPQCGAPLKVDAVGSCSYCHALALTGGSDWVVWSAEEEPW